MLPQKIPERPAVLLIRLGMSGGSHLYNNFGFKINNDENICSEKNY
jgi:hypothetical protein